MHGHANSLTLTYGRIDAGILRHRAAFLLLNAIWLFHAATIVCSTVGLILLALMTLDANLANQALLGLLAAGDAAGGHNLIRPVA